MRFARRTSEGEGVRAALALSVDVDTSNAVGHDVDERAELGSVALGEDGGLLPERRVGDVINNLRDVREASDWDQGAKLLLVPDLHVRLRPMHRVSIQETPRSRWNTSQGNAECYGWILHTRSAAVCR